jgi:hypothetical protein
MNFVKERIKEHIKLGISSMRAFWHGLPEQLKRLIVIVILLIAALVVVRSIFVPADFGIYGHYRTSAVEEIISQPIHYAGQELCFDCHDEIGSIKMEGYHRDLSCEVCHGPSASHTEEPEEIKPIAPRERGYCPLCHEYLPSRPTGFPQIISASHNPMSPCISCHEPHNPEPPETPKECSACHAEIARTIALSHHVYVPCVRCHNAPEEHKINPRGALPTKPATREFCGSCHAEDASSERGIPRIDLESHETRYMCWQCHYPHLPEAR